MSERAFRILLSPQGDPERPDAWTAEVPELKGCVSHGASAQEALESIEDAKTQWLQTARELGLEVPDASRDLDEFSGKFTVRLPKSLHRHLTYMALLEGVSLNQYVIYLLSGRGAGRMTNETSDCGITREFTEIVKKQWVATVPGRDLPRFDHWAYWPDTGTARPEEASVYLLEGRSRR